MRGLAAAVAEGGGVFVAEFGGKGVDGEAAVAGEGLIFGDLGEGGKHQEFAAFAGGEVVAARFEVGAEAAGDDDNEGAIGFADGFGNGLFAG